MNEEPMMNAMATAAELSKVANRITNNISQSLLNMIENLKPVINQVSKIMATEFMTGFSNALRNYAEQVQHAKNNPNSYFNYMHYQNDLDNMHWAWPYGIDAEELKYILENAHSEKEFDALMRKYFKPEKIEKMIGETIIGLPSRHQMMLKQAKNAFDRGDYAIANNALMSIIDNLLSEYVLNKGQSKRVGILIPIIDYYKGFPLRKVDFIFELCMLSNNIDFLFQDYRFNESIKIETNKKIRRHPSLHGVKYSNKRTDTLLLFNTLVNLINQREILDKFKNSLVIEHKRFTFSDKAKMILAEEKCKDIILSAIQLDGKVDHSTLLITIDKVIPETVVNKGKYLSILLQKMRKSEPGIECTAIEGKKYWEIKNTELE
ncbi:MAG: hypothetical protein IKU09_03500 [Firmicutes bacterium]|nr:hypothetical protein [Bacillota bacterium]